MVLGWVDGFNAEQVEQKVTAEQPAFLQTAVTGSIAGSCCNMGLDAGQFLPQHAWQTVKGRARCM